MFGQQLAGLVALITGGAGGIGSATVRRFVGEGAKVVFTDIDAARGAGLAREVGDAASFAPGDHNRPADNEAAVALAVDRYGGLDILYNNAATVSHGPIGELGEAELRNFVDASLIGPFLMTQAALPALRARSHARRSILFTGSIQSLMVRPGYTVYGMVKHGIGGLVGSLALELAPEGIRVNAVCPGPVDTPLLRAGIAKTAPTMAEAIALRTAGIPLGRLITTDEIAAAAVFLSSDQASAVTGLMFPVDGGIAAH